MGGYKLTYFNSRGRGEIIRLVFAAAGVEYDDVRVEWAGGKDWPGTLKATTPFGQLPMLEADGVKLCQSTACARYIAKKYKLAGKSAVEEAQADMIVDCMEDTVKPLIKYIFEPDEATKETLKKKYLEEELPNFLNHLEALLKNNHGGDKFFVGTDLTWADLSLQVTVGWLVTVGIENPLAKYPKLSALNHKVEALPKIAAWLAKRPKTQY